MSKGLFLVFAIALLWSCQPKETKWAGQAPAKRVSTLTRPIQYQLKKTFDLGNGIFLSNEFDGARLNGVALTGENEVTVLITPENTPVNASPWYAFKIWSTTSKDIDLKITYNEGVGHRYYPKLSADGKNWTKVDSTVYIADTASIANGEQPKFCSFSLSLSPDTTWVSAQELIVSKDINKWAAGLAEKEYVSMAELAKSKEGRTINYLQIGNPDSKKMLMVLSRQHPPEITGWLAMQAFIERICTDDELSEKFRNEYNIFLVPCVNPDGVDNGHWRHGAGGIDLNRDWDDFNQPETRAVNKFMKSKVADGSKFYFAVDFHSTQHDIYYTVAPELKGNMPGLVPKVLTAMGEEIPGYDPNIDPSSVDELRISSTLSIFHEFKAETVTFEVGDDTPRDFIEKKGKLTAENLMKIMLED
ncbi:M14 family metallopeptidase [uncultured Draconibacterium sp.]|uniref:M14 family metallopeptidase n=1 Tax=uncultured Draconibacterium sp. TaxID=1573823 RepID=UPI0029C8EFE0|nr:M14 family metallopeptidase [uncultured Draconibacterium sp.]